MPASAANVPSAVPTLPNLFDAVDDVDDQDDYPVVSTRPAGASRAAPLRLAPPPVAAPVAPVRQTLVPAAPASDGWLVTFDDEDEDVTVETAKTEVTAKVAPRCEPQPASPPQDELELENADVIEEVVAVESLESGIRRAPVSLPPPLPRAAAAPAPVAASPAPAPRAPPMLSAPPPPSVPPVRSRLWGDSDL